MLCLSLSAVLFLQWAGRPFRFFGVSQLKTRQQVAFEILHPQVEIAKRSPTVQIAVDAAISGLVLTGNLACTAGLAGVVPLEAVDPRRR